MASLRLNLIVTFSLWLVAEPLAATGAAPAVEPAQNATAWLHWLIPLPKEVSIQQQVTLPAADVKITLLPFW